MKFSTDEAEDEPDRRRDKDCRQKAHSERHSEHVTNSVRGEYTPFALPQSRWSATKIVDSPG